MMWGVDGLGWVGMGFGMILWVVLTIAVVWIFARLVPRSESGPPVAPPGLAATEELRARFARGEISEEEYRTRLAVLDERPTRS